MWVFTQKKKTKGVWVSNSFVSIDNSVLTVSWESIDKSILTEEIFTSLLFYTIKVGSELA